MNRRNTRAEPPDGRVIAVEVKSGATVWIEDLAGLRHLGERLVAGYVMYTGQQTLTFGGKIKALPVEALWQASDQRQQPPNDFQHNAVIVCNDDTG